MAIIRTNNLNFKKKTDQQPKSQSESLFDAFYSNEKYCKHLRRTEYYLPHSMEKIIKCIDCGIQTFDSNVAGSQAYTGRTHQQNHNGSIAIGANSYSSGENSIAIGYSSGYNNNSYNSGGYSGNNSYNSGNDNNINMTNLRDYEERLNKRLEDLERKIGNINNNVDESLNKVDVDNRNTLFRPEVEKFFASRGMKQSPPPPPPRPRAQQMQYAADYNSTIGGRIRMDQQQPPEPKKEPVTLTEYIHLMYRGSNIEENTIKDVKYYDVTFYFPLDQNDSSLDLLEAGDVIEWKEVRKESGALSFLSPKVKMIKAIRINSEELDKLYKEKYGN